MVDAKAQGYDMATPLRPMYIHILYSYMEPLGYFRRFSSRVFQSAPQFQVARSRPALAFL